MISIFDGLHFVTSGDLENTDSRTSKVFDYYGIQYNHAGSFTLAIDHGTPRKYTGPHVILTYPKHHFEYGATSPEGRHHIFCCFAGPRAEEFVRCGLFPMDPENPVIRITRTDRFLSAMRSLLAILRRPGSEELGHARAVLLLEDLLLQLKEQPTLPDSEQHFYPALKALADDIRRNPHLEWDMKKEAAQIGVSEPYLRKLFTACFDCPPHKFLLECRLQKACDLLMHKNIAIADVAQESGFDDPYYFSRIFKKRKGYSPLHFRSAFAP